MLNYFNFQNQYLINKSIFLTTLVYIHFQEGVNNLFEPESYLTDWLLSSDARLPVCSSDETHFLSLPLVTHN